jgi:hypothetical protein
MPIWLKCEENPIFPCKTSMWFCQFNKSLQSLYLNVTFQPIARFKFQILANRLLYWPDSIWFWHKLLSKYDN